MNRRYLTPEQQAMVETWERHMAAEFQRKSIDATMATMTSTPFVNHVPVMTGGVGSSEVRHFYSLIDAEKLPGTGIEASRKVVDPTQEPSNRLIKRASG
jgi:hypothetical protein